MLGRTSYVHKQLVMIVIAPQGDDSARLKVDQAPPMFFGTGCPLAGFWFAGLHGGRLHRSKKLAESQASW